ncbi:MAG: hypothetical protein IPK60_18220 [Sandaracinaceae bacterium]|nr:hypothetical protein [Sandaracinaceae bacterium]
MSDTSRNVSRDVSPRSREIFLMVAFAAIVAGGIVTVLIPALNQDSEREEQGQSAQRPANGPSKAQGRPANPPQSH